MDWKIFLTTFVTIFIAEIGDKTQFAALLMASQTKSTYSVLFATVLALSIAGAIGVLLGTTLGRLIDPEKIKYISGLTFIVMGVFILSKS